MVDKKFATSRRLVGPLIDVAGRVLTTFELDRSCLAEYRINNFGFRGQDFDDQALKHYFSFGCSYTFGTGLREEDIWAAHLREHYARYVKVPLSEVNHMNFGVTGASNSEIAKLSVLQCSAFRPDLAIIMFTHQERHEMIIGDKVLNIGPWSVDADYLSEELKELSAIVYSSYRNEQGAIDMVRQMLFVQYFMESKGIEYLIVTSAPLQDVTLPCRDLIEHLNQRRIVWLPNTIKKQIDRSQFRWIDNDLAYDGIHFGPGLHKYVGSLVWRRCEKLLKNQRRRENSCAAF